MTAKGGSRASEELGSRIWPGVWVDEDESRSSRYS